MFINNLTFYEIQEKYIERRKEGTFVPEGENDEVTLVLGNPEHGGRVRTAGQGVTKTEYFGSRRSRNVDTVSRAEHDALTVI